MKDKIKVRFLILFFLIIAIYPKINIISIPGSRTGIRFDDIFFGIYFIFLIKNIIKNGFKYYGKFSNIVKVFIICVISFFISNVLGFFNGNVKIMLSTLHLVRKIQYFLLIFAGYDLAKLLDKEKFEKILKIVIIFHIGFVILSLFKIIPDIGFLIDRISNDRAYSTFSGPYELAGFLLLPVPFLLMNLIKEKKYINLFYIVMCFIGIYLSESRISLLAFIIIIFITLYFKVIKNKSLKLILPLVVLILGILLFINPLHIKKLDRFSSVNISSFITTTKDAWNSTNYNFYKENGYIYYKQEVTNSTNDLSFAMRISKWTTLIKESLKTPLFGMGLSVAGEAMDGSFVRLFCETGIIGLILWLFLLATIIKESKILKEEDRWIIKMMILSLIIGSLFIDIFEASKIMMIFWFIIGFLFYDTKENKIKVCHIVSGFDYGGVENVIYNYYKNINHNNFSNSIISHNKINKNNSDMFKNYNFKFYEVTPKSENMFKNFFQLMKIIHKINPDIIHVHMSESSFLALFIALLCGVKIRICHAHTNVDLNSKTGKIEKLFCNLFANEYFSCSYEAAKNLFNNRNMKKVVIIKNAFDIEKFDYNEKIRKELRKKYKVDNDFVLGHVGRFSKEKNHKKVITVFRELLKRNNNAKLLLIGDGETKKDVINNILDIKEKVIIIDSTNEIEKYYQMIDALILPSLSEGLGIVIIEAQVSGLNCFVANNISKDVIQTDNVTFIDINRDDKVWADEISKVDIKKRKSQLKRMLKSDYNLKNNERKLEEYYINYIKHYM